MASFQVFRHFVGIVTTDLHTRPRPNGNTVAQFSIAPLTAVIFHLSLVSPLDGLG